MKTSLKDLKQFIDNDVHFSSAEAQRHAQSILQCVLHDFNKEDTANKMTSLRIKPMRAFCFMI